MKLKEQIMKVLEEAAKEILAGMVAPDMDGLDDFREQLKDWTNREEAGTRFPKLHMYGAPITIKCPRCGSEDLLEDNWPPNYGGSSAGGGYSKSYGSVKVVCPNDKIHFTVSYSYEYIDNELKDREVQYGELIDLAEFEGKLLTPNDVYCEEYKEEHGKYPRQVYG